MSQAPIKQVQKLCKSPSSEPIYPVVIKNSKGVEVVCGDPKFSRALLALMNMGAVNGGAACHWGGPAAMSECWSALHSLMFQKDDWYEQYNFINDIGHAENGIYALRTNLGYGDLTLETLKGFRSIKSKLTGHGESHLYPEGVLLSNGPLGSSLGQAQGLCFADRLSGKERVTIVTMSDGASMEGEAKESFAAIAGLASKDKMNPFVLVISDNNTKLSGRIEKDSFSMKPSFEVMKDLGWETIKVDKGNDLESCYHSLELAIEKAKSQKKPVFVWLKTVKGFGVKSTEESSSGGHGFPVKPYSEEIGSFVREVLGSDIPSSLLHWTKELTTRPSSSEDSTSAIPKEKAQAGFSRGAINAVKNGFPVFSVSSDLAGSTGMNAFQNAHPELSLDIGIAESNMVSHAAGMSKAGHIPIVDTFAAFGVTKGNLPLIMAALSACPMIAVFSHTGFQDAADGASHQSLTYISALGSIPHTKLIVVSTSAEAEAFMEMAISDIASKKEKGIHPDSYIFYVGRENFVKSFDTVTSFSFGKAQVIRKGTKGVVVSAGPTIFSALEVADELDLTVINNSCVNDIDYETIIKELEGNHKLVTVEDHQLIGGLGQQVVFSLKQARAKFNSVSLGVKGEFGQSAYKAGELYAKHGLDGKAIREAFLSL